MLRGENLHKHERMKPMVLMQLAIQEVLYWYTMSTEKSIIEGLMVITRTRANIAT